MRKTNSNEWGKRNPQAKLKASREAMRRHRAKDPATYLWKQAKRRAEAKGLPFNIEVSDIHIPEACPLLGTEIVYGGGRDTLDDAPALDRIENHKGYVKGNIWVVSHRANSAKRDLSILEFVRMANVMSNLKCVSYSIWKPGVGLTFKKPERVATLLTPLPASPWPFGTLTE